MLYLCIMNKRTINGVDIYIDIKNEKSYGICWQFENSKEDNASLTYHVPYTMESEAIVVGDYFPKMAENSRYSAEDAGNFITQDIYIENHKPLKTIENTIVCESEYDRFMKQYHEDHKYCPKCGCEEHLSSLFGYVLNLDKKDEYKDKNNCICSKCDLSHITHDRVAENKYNENYTKTENKYTSSKKIIKHIVVSGDISDIEIEKIIDDFNDKYNKPTLR